MKYVSVVAWHSRHSGAGGASIGVDHVIWLITIRDVSVGENRITSSKSASRSRPAVEESFLREALTANLLIWKPRGSLAA
jgi:hypothetical protein